MTLPSYPDGSRPERPVRPPRPLPPRPLPPGGIGSGWGPGVVVGGGYWQGDRWYDNDWGGNWNGRIIRCESWNYRYRECRANTAGGVRLSRVIAGNCRRGYSFGVRGDRIWVHHGCRADFQVRYGGGGGWYDDGPSAGEIIGGVAVAGGLIALLAAASKSSRPSAPQGAPPPPAWQPPASPTGPARINIPAGTVSGDAAGAFNTCVTEAARQIGATGGTEISLDRMIETEKGNGGYRFRMNLRGQWPDEARLVPTYCRATSSEVVELTFG